MSSSARIPLPSDTRSVDPTQTRHLFLASLTTVIRRNSSRLSTWWLSGRHDDSITGRCKRIVALRLPRRHPTLLLCTYRGPVAAMMAEQ